jgi:hypothetical protein
MFYHNGMGADYGDKALPPLPTNKSVSVKYGFELVYFSQATDSAYISINGGTSLEMGPFINYYTTETSGRIFYRKVNVSAQLEELTLQIQKSYSGFEEISKFHASNAFVITWYLVPLKIDPSKLQTFQLVLVTDGTMSFCIANFERTDELTFDDHGTRKNKMSRYTDADKKRFFFLGGLLTTNCDTPGRWIFRVDGAGATGGPAIERKITRAFYHTLTFNFPIL